MGQSIIFMVLIFGIIYFMMIRPQQRREKEKENMLSKIKAGDAVLTIGGLKGEVVSVTTDWVTLKVDRDTKLEFKRSSILQILDGSEENADAKDKEK